MSAIVDSLENSLQRDFDLARLDLAEARRELQHKDTPAARRRLAACRARVDHILDTWNDAALTSA